jgi:hypothetical protein
MRCVLRGSRRRQNLLSAALLTLLVGVGSTPAAARSCASLGGLVLPATTITVAQSIPGGTYTAPNGQAFTGLPAFCRIAATLTPTSDSDINIEVWMPFSAWNGRYLGLGNGGFGGIFLYDILARYLPLNYAIAQTDNGTSPGATLGFKVLTGHPEKQIDYATRSTNLMTVRAKQIIKAFYGERPRYSYFVGCSGGGGSAVHEALQFPGDYDGIVAGAPFMNITHRSARPLELLGVQWPGHDHADPGDRNYWRCRQTMCRQGRRLELGQFSDRSARLPLESSCAAMHRRSRRRGCVPDGDTGGGGARVLRRSDQPTHGRADLCGKRARKRGQLWLPGGFCDAGAKPSPEVGIR